MSATGSNLSPFEACCWTENAPPPYTLAVGYGSDKVHALLTLWQTLHDSDAATEAIDYVVTEYTHRTGTVPEKSNARPHVKGHKA